MGSVAPYGRARVPDPRRSCSVRVTGVVQGVGFRPFVHTLATHLGLTGHVGNDPGGVFLEVTGEAGAVSEFLRRLRSDAPALALVEDVVVTDHPEIGHVTRPPQPDASGRARVFRIVASASTPPAASPNDPAPATTASSIPPDTAVCAECLAELRDPADRRFGYPFIACTQCGPRFTMVTGLPYDRANTTMADFPLCPECRAEYEDPTGRRFHAQPTACATCGPRLSMPVDRVAAALGEGAIVAIKGVGGYHLACDARDAPAVARLRERKRRGGKPFAVMVPSLAAARAIAQVDADQAALLESQARPIVLVDSRDPELTAAVAPGTGQLGVMLPYTPLHHLLFDAGAPRILVMTSGNLADEPICTSEQEAESRLSGIADLFCHHDRRIHVACDDSVVRIVRGRPQPVRRSRGYAPMPVGLPLDSPPIVAVGGELKATAAVASGRRAWLTQHVGDTENLETLDMLARSIQTLVSLQHVRPELVVSDAHPGYLSHGWARRYAEALGAEHVVVQHHHAHLGSLLAEHGIEPGLPVLGVVFDGTGYGSDATIWGGELLLGSYASVQRVGHLRPVLLPGGDAAIRHPARTAHAHLAAAGVDATGTASAAALDAGQGRLLGRMLATGSHCVPTTSVGRLFDAVASLLDVRHEVEYEAQAAIELEALAAGAVRAEQAAAAGRAEPAIRTERGGPWESAVTLSAAGVVIIDPRPWIVRAVAEHAAGVPAGMSARAFHGALARSVADAAAEVRRHHDVSTVALTGGVFANALLTSECVAALDAQGFTVLTHRLVPPNDGGLALGQVVVAATGPTR